MEKKYISLPYLALFIFLSVVSFSKIECCEKKSVPIYPDDVKFDRIGSCCDMKKNGECLVINHFIHPGMIIFDAGANIGNWSKYVLTYKSPVTIYAFEPIPPIFQHLQKNLAQYNAVHLYNIALFDQSITKSFIYYQKCDEWSSFFQRVQAEKEHDTQPKIIEVKTITLDDFCDQNNINHIDFLKIDTEGSELAILHGAHQLLEQGKISTIQFEYGGTYPDAKITLKQVYDLLTSYGFTIFKIIANGLVHIKQWRPGLENNMYSNFVAIKQS